MEKSLYKILGLRKDATTDEVRRAYRRLSKRFHPDAPKGNAEKFREIKEAYDILKDKDSRKKYDETGEVEKKMSFEEMITGAAVSSIITNISSILSTNNPSMFETENIMEPIRLSADKARESAKSEILVLEGTIDVLTSLKEHYVSDGDTNVVHSAINKEIIQCKKKIESNEATIQISRMVKQILSNIVFKKKKYTVNDSRRKLRYGDFFDDRY